MVPPCPAWCLSDKPSWQCWQSQGMGPLCLASQVTRSTSDLKSAQGAMDFLNHFWTDSFNLVGKTIETFVFKYVKRAGLYNICSLATHNFTHISFGKHSLTSNYLFRCTSFKLSMFSHTTQLKNHRHRSLWLHHTTPTFLSCQSWLRRLANGERWAADTNNPGSWWQKLHGRIKKGKEKCSETVTKPLKVLTDSCRIYQNMCTCWHVAFYDALTTSCCLVKWSIPPCPHLLTRDPFDEEIMTKNHCSKNMKQSQNNNHLQWTQGLYPKAIAGNWFHVWLWAPSHNAWCSSQHRAPDSHSNAWKRQLPGTQSR